MIDADASRRRWATTRWTAFALVISTPLLLSMGWALWRAPYPISETVSLLQLAGVMREAPPATDSLVDPVVRNVFDPFARSWYRPFYHMSWYVFWQVTHSLPATLMLFRVLLEITPAVATVVLLLLAVRPSTLIEGAAAAVAAAVLMGTAGFRDNLEIPLPITLVAMPLVLLVHLLLEQTSAHWKAWAIALMIVVAVGYKEQGLVLVPMVFIAWLAGAPGASRRLAVTVVVLAVAYLGFRLSFKSAWQPFEQDVGLGFATVSLADAAARFGQSPYGIYLYNMAATVGHILLSEPTGGVFATTRDVLAGRAAPWQLTQVWSSATLSALIAWWAVRTWRRERGRPWSAELRVALATGVVIAASGALAFNYSRDRLDGMAVPLYAMSAFYAFRELSHSLRGPSLARRVTVVVLLLSLAAAWQLRAVGTVDWLYVSSVKDHREWLTDLSERRRAFAADPAYLRILEAMTPQGTDAQPSSPEWLQPWLGSR